MPLWLFFGAPLGTNAALVGMNFAYLASPFVSVPGKRSIDLMAMDYAYLGQPFISYARG